MTGPVRVVLDWSAVAAYATGSEAVGEILTEVADEGCSYAIPATALTAGAAAVDADVWSMIELLLVQDNCVYLNYPGRWKDQAHAAVALGDVLRAEVMLAAVDHRAFLLTAEPEVYGGTDSEVVIGI